MASVHADVLDTALNEISSSTTKLHICSAEPANYSEVSTYDLGKRDSPTFSGPVDGDTSGRKITVDAIGDGSISAGGIAKYWALVDDNNSKLVAAGSLDDKTIEVITGYQFTLEAFDIEIQDPA